MSDTLRVPVQPAEYLEIAGNQTVFPAIPPELEHVPHEERDQAWIKANVKRYSSYLRVERSREDYENQGAQK